MSDVTRKVKFPEVAAFGFYGQAMSFDKIFSNALQFNSSYFRTLLLQRFFSAGAPKNRVPLNKLSL